MFVGSDYDNIHILSQNNIPRKHTIFFRIIIIIINTKIYKFLRLRPFTFVLKSVELERPIYIVFNIDMIELNFEWIIDFRRMRPQLDSESKEFFSFCGIKSEMNESEFDVTAETLDYKIRYVVPTLFILFLRTYWKFFRFNFLPKDIHSHKVIYFGCFRRCWRRK